MKIRLREIREDDLSFLNQCRNKFAVSRSLNMFHPKPLEGEQQWFHKPKDEVHFLIEADGNAAGQASLIHFSRRDRKAEFTIFLDEPYWGKGYGRIATKLMVHYGFYELNLHKIFLHVYKGNDAARKMYEKTGFCKEGLLRDFIFREGEYIDAHHYGILCDEFFEIEDNLKGISEPLLYESP